MKILVVTRDAPIPGTGSAIVKYKLAQHFAALGHEVRFCYLKVIYGKYGDEIRRYVNQGNLFLHPMFEGLDEIEAQARRMSIGYYRNGLKAAMDSRRPNQFDILGAAINFSGAITPIELAFTEEIIRKYGPEVVVADFVWLCDVFDSPLAKNLLKCVFTYDIIYLRNESFVAQGLAPDHPGWSAEEEVKLLGKADLLVGIKKEDSVALREICPDKTIVTSPLPYDIPDSKASGDEPVCLFVGSHGTPNVHGLTWFLEEVWPEILRRRPDANMRVCGNVCEHIDGGHPNVRLLGKVDDLSAEYANAAVVLAPLLVGSGIKIKVLEALGYGRACATTTVGIEGIQEAANKGALIADSAPAMAHNVIALLNDGELRHEMESCALDYARTHLSADAVYKELLEALNAGVAARRRA
jgi:glycosyltransferase involved in cell wall biosynthesis